jgi:hypothetical protein
MVGWRRALENLEVNAGSESECIVRAGEKSGLKFDAE